MYLTFEKFCFVFDFMIIDTFLACLIERLPDDFIVAGDSAFILQNIFLACLVLICPSLCPFYPLGDRGRPTGYCHSDVHPSVRRSHFQLSLTAKVSEAFVLYCMVMVPSKGNLRF